MLGSSPIIGCRPPTNALSRTEAPSLHRNYPASAVLRASPSPGWPPSVPRGLGVAAPSRGHRRLLVFLAWSFAACRSLYPGGSAECTDRLLLPHGSTSPLVRRVVFRSDTFRGLIGFSLALRPAASRNHLVILSTEGSGQFVSSLAASIATGQSDDSQAGLAPAEPKQVSRRTDQPCPFEKRPECDLGRAAHP